MNSTMCTWVSEVKAGSVDAFAQLTGSLSGTSTSLSVLNIVTSSKDKVLALSTTALFLNKQLCTGCLAKDNSLARIDGVPGIK